MKRTLLTVLSVFLITGLAVSQKAPPGFEKHDTAAYYMRFNGALARTDTDAQFLRLIIKAEPRMYNIEDYYMDAKPKLVAKSFSGEMNFESGAHGPYVEFYPNGNKKSMRQYDHGKIIGYRRDFYPNGMLYTVLDYNKDTGHLRRCQDSTGKVLADNGNGDWIYYDDNFAVASVGMVKDGKEDGVWIAYNKRGKEINDYVNGTMISKKLPGDSSLVFLKVDKAPKFPGGEKELNMFLVKHTRYPAVARENYLSGRVTVRFIVEIDGTLTNMEIARGAGEELDNEALRVMALFPKWIPGSINDSPVRVQFSVPIEFALGNN